MTTQTEATANANLAAEQKRRGWIMTKAPKKITISFFRFPSMGAPEKERSDFATQKSAFDLAEKRGLDVHAHRGHKGGRDTGFQVHNQVSNVTGEDLLLSLAEAGYIAVEVFESPAKQGVKTCIVMMKEGEPVTVPELVRDLLDKQNFTVTVWANPHEDDDGSLFRMDTINLNPTWRNKLKGATFPIRMVGNTYKID